MSHKFTKVRAINYLSMNSKSRKSALEVKKSFNLWKSCNYYVNCESTYDLTIVYASIYDKTAGQPFDTIHDILRSLSFTQYLLIAEMRQFGVAWTDGLITIAIRKWKCWGSNEKQIELPPCLKFRQKMTPSTEKIHFMILMIIHDNSWFSPIYFIWIQNETQV